MPTHTLVLGGIRSGKSDYAQAFVNGSQDLQFIATAQLHPGDSEFDRRIERHRARRPKHWQTVESTHGLAGALRHPTSTILIDDMGGWMTAMLDDAGWSGEIGACVDEVIDALQVCPVDVVIVSPEVGLSVVPATSSGRTFADEIGTLNQKLAQVCDNVFLITAGLPQTLKGGGK